MRKGLLASRTCPAILTCLVWSMGLLMVPATWAADSARGKEVRSRPIQVNRVLFLGNSITRHGPAPAIGWTGDWGMAASAPEKDYVRLVLRGLAGTNGKEPQALVTNVADFERHFETYDPGTRLAKELAFKPDLVILAVGENVPALTAEPARAAFQAKTTQLLKKFQENSNPVIVVRSCFWPNPVKDTILERACREVGGIFVNAGVLGKEEANHARSERKFQHAGVAAHPGDRGMKAIAAAILEALRQGK